MYLQTKLVNKVIHWRIDRPDRGNALGPTIASLLTTEMNKLKLLLEDWQAQDFPRRTAPCRVLVLEATPAGQSKDIWIAGGDLHELSELKTSQDARAYADSLSSFCTSLEEIPIPVIVNINGAVIGGGAEVALAGDLRFGGPKTKFEFRQLKAGLIIGYGSSRRLVDTVGMALAKSLLFQSTSLSALECYNKGLLNKLSNTQNELDNLVAKTCQQFIDMEPKSFAFQKKMLRVAATATYCCSKKTDLDLFESLWMNPTHKLFLENFKTKHSQL